MTATKENPNYKRLIYPVTFHLKQMFSTDILIETEDGIVTKVPNDKEYNGKLAEKIIGKNILEVKTLLEEKLYKAKLFPVQETIMLQQISATETLLRVAESCVEKNYKTYESAIATSANFQKRSELAPNYEQDKKSIETHLLKATQDKASLDKNIAQHKATIIAYKSKLEGFRAELKKEINWETNG